MAFEDWCFNLFLDKFPTADVKKEEAILRTDDGGTDIIFEASDSQEVFILQCKYPLVSQVHPIPEGDVKEFFTNFSLLKDKRYAKQRDYKNPRVAELSNEIRFWIENGWVINFIFITTDTRTPAIDALIDKYNKDFSKDIFSIKFDAWGLAELKDVWTEVQSVVETYPESLTLTLPDEHYLIPDGKLRNITFAVKGTELQKIAKQFKEGLFNWNIRRYLGKKGEVNKGLLKTIEEQPENFYYYNNGISMLCEKFEFNDKSKKLIISKAQIVNGAQTIGALKIADPGKLKDVLVLVKLTEIKHHNREIGVAAELIRTNNTQNKLSIPDFRSNDPIQIWLELNFKNTKPRGELLQIDYGRKKPYPRSSQMKQVIKLQDLGKIRYAWLHDPRIPISDPASLFTLPSERGLYGYAFGTDGEVVDLWSTEQFKEVLLSIHSFNKINESLNEFQAKNEEFKQITRLKYYALKLFKMYWDEETKLVSDSEREDFYKFGERFNNLFKKGEKLIVITLRQAYKEILNREEGTAFSLPRDQKVWDLVRAKFADNLELSK